MWLIPSNLSALDCSASAVAPACSTSPSNSPGSTSLASARVWWVSQKGKPTPQVSSWPGWKKRVWSKRLFSAATSETWTPDLCGDLLTSLPPDCPASLTAPQASSRALKMPVAGAAGMDPCPMRCASLKKQSPPWSASKMCRSGSRAGRSENLAMRYARWVTRSKTRSLPVRAKWVQAIAASASSYWPTCRANEANSSYQRDRGEKGKERPTLNGLTREWRTPRNNTGPSTDAQHLSLDGQAREWPTPMSRDSDESGGPGFATLPRKVKEWPTPAARDFRSANSANRRALIMTGSQLPNFVAHNWPTPRTSDVTSGRGVVELNGTFYRPGPHRLGDGLSDVSEGFFLLPGLSLETGPTSLPPLPTYPRRLNPVFVCWLMGWPWHWTLSEVTSFGAEATALWWARQQQLLCIFSND